MSSDPLIRKSPYEPGLYFVHPQPGTTLQSIGTTEWKVGERYTLHKVLGYGSFSCVCLATDNTSGEKVALKRIGDVMHSLDQAKRVLRELAIMHRTSHPNLIGLRDAFIRPSATGQCRMVDGKLVHASIDLYIAMEYADGGDLFHMRGQLTLEEVTSLLWQLLQALSYLHSLNIWHRDVKSQNAFIHWDNGIRVVKLGDLGSARSAIPLKTHIQDDREEGEEEFNLPHQHVDNNNNNTNRQNPLPPHDQYMHTIDSYAAMDEAMVISDLYTHAANDSDSSARAQNNTKETKNAAPTRTTNFNTLSTSNTILKTSSRGGRGSGFRPPLTRVVATPCYRAPEVVMSRGGYTAAIDIWGVGCIMGELLQRIAYVGSTSTPNLQVAPLFAIKGMPKTPDGIETFGKPECLGTRQELKALFDVLGTPAWSDAAAVEMPEWKSYMEKLPGKAPTLYRRFKAAGEVAVHLLSRLLDFDPVRRAACEEALAHEFFEELRHEVLLQSHGSVGGVVQSEIGIFNAMQNTEEDDEKEMKKEEVMMMNIDIPATPNAEEEGKKEKGKKEEETEEECRLSMLHSESYAIAAAAAAAAATSSSPKSEHRQFYEEYNPGVALSKLETVLKSIEVASSQQHEVDLDPLSDGCQRLRQLLEAECQAIANGELASRRRRADQYYQQHQGTGISGTGISGTGISGTGISGTGSGGTGSGTGTGSGGTDGNRRGSTSHFKPISRNSRSIEEVFRRRETTLQIDTLGNDTVGIGVAIQHRIGGSGSGGSGAVAGHEMPAAVRNGGLSAADIYGKERLSNVADTQQGKELDPNKFLGQARHGEWVLSGGGGGRPEAGPRWGVSTVPPGLEESSSDPRVQAIIKKQQER